MKTRVKRIILFSLLGIVFMLGAGYFGYKSYRSVRQTRLVKQAREFMDKSEPRKALLALQRALRYNGNDLEACRLMAQLADAGRSPNALFWRSRVVDLNPDSLEDRLALVHTSLTARDYTSATNALSGVSEAGKKTASYNNVAGLVAAQSGQLALAEHHFLEASRAEPANPALQLNLAVVRLQGTNAQRVAEARSALATLSKNPTNSFLRCQALRELATDALRRKEFPSALASTQQLLCETNSQFTDKVLHLQILHSTKSPNVKATLENYQKAASNDPAKIEDLANWQLQASTPADVLAWLVRLPETQQTNLTVTVLTAECRARLKDWKGLQTSLQKQNWGDVDYLRHAFLAYSQRGQELATAAKGEWELALKTASANKVLLRRLLVVAARWGWVSEAEDILWTIVDRFPGERWAVQALTESLYKAGRTRPLMMLYSQETKRFPADLNFKNNLAATALLLEAYEVKPHELALEVYQKAPTNAAFASTFAFSLHRQKKNGDALKVMQQLTPKQLEDPTIAGYYGLILRSTGNPEKARSYLEWGSKAPLLPEERKLFDAAKAGV